MTRCNGDLDLQTVSISYCMDFGGKPTATPPRAAILMVCPERRRQMLNPN